MKREHGKWGSGSKPKGKGKRAQNDGMSAEDRAKERQGKRLTIIEHTGNEGSTHGIHRSR